MTPQGHFTKFTKALMAHAKYGRVAAFQEYVNSPAFIEALNGMDLKRRQSAMAAFHKAMSLCEAKAHGGLSLTKATTTRGEKGGKGRWNNPTMLAKLRNAYAKARTDAGAARLLGVSEGAARLAKRRYLDAMPPLQIAA